MRDERLSELKERFGLTSVGEPFAAAGERLVAPVIDGEGRRRVLKVLGDPTSCERAAEALARWSGRGAVELIDHDASLGALLLQRAEPGSTLEESEADPLGAARIFADVARRLRVGDRLPVLPDITDWLAILTRPGALGGAREEDRRRATEVSEKLVQRGGSRVLLHGDLHHANILRHERGWLAADPKGVLGPPEAEPAAFLRNPRDLLTGRPDAADLSRRRATAVADELDLDGTAVMRWAYVLCVIAAAWALEDAEGGDEVERWMACAGVLREAADRPG